MTMPPLLYRRRRALLLSVALCALAGGAAAVGQDAAPDPRASGDNVSASVLYLDNWDPNTLVADQEYGKPHARQSVDGNPIRLDGVMYAHGIGTHAHSEIRIDLKGGATRFVSDVGVDDEKKGSHGSVDFQVWVDGKRVAGTDVLHPGDVPRRISVDLTGAQRLMLVADDGGDGIDSDHADWAGALLVLTPDAVADAKKRPSPHPALTADRQEPPPKIATAEENAGGDAPAIHGPRVVGTTPGRPFLYRIPATGARPITFQAEGLPPGLTLDAATGVISGSIPPENLGKPVTMAPYIVTLTATGPRHGRRHRQDTATRKLVIIAGDHRLALTPPMGWNSWNVWGTSVTADKVKAAADSFISSGLADHGFAYVNIDDTWEGKRDPATGEITTNAKFGDMKALAAYVHAKGLKLGIYSSPGPKTCDSYEGSYQHEAQDARTWGDWGIDYLKYDWCSYGRIAPTTGLKGVPMYEKPYQVMRQGLDGSSRDIVFSLCQYGMGNVWEWGAASESGVGGNAWRTTGDIRDSWGSMSKIGFRQDVMSPYAGPGHWNDPDMLVVGTLGWGPNLHPTHLSGNEQITHITLWSLLAAPLLIGCDLTRLDAFTKALLTNDEVLDVDQDPLGKAAIRVAYKSEGVAGMPQGAPPLGGEAWARPLFDGTRAVGLFNRTDEAVTAHVSWADLGLTGPQPVRDLWRRRDVGTFETGYFVRVPAHGAVLIKVGKPQVTEYVPSAMAAR